MFVTLALGVGRLRRIVASTVLVAITPLTPVAFPSQTDGRLNILFDRLKATESEAEAAALTHEIWFIWGQSESDTVNGLMAEGVAAMSRRAYGEALAVFNKVVETDPSFAEGWNKRATVHFLMGEYEASVRDVERTLALEPRHFGALSGLGLIYLAVGDDGGALRAFEAALKVNPHLPGARAHAERLRRRVRRDSI